MSKKGLLIILNHTLDNFARGLHRFLQRAERLNQLYFGDFVVLNPEDIQLNCVFVPAPTKKVVFN
jgi:hypothetical protein